MRWGVVTSVAPLEVRMDGDTADTPIAVVNRDLALVTGDKVAIDRRGLQQVAAYALSAGNSGFGPFASRPTSGRFVGDTYSATDTNRDYRWDGTGWIIMFEPPQNLSLTAGAGTLFNVTLGTAGSSVLRYQRSAGFLHWTYRLILGTGGAMGTDPGIRFPIRYADSTPPEVCTNMFMYNASDGARYYGSTSIAGGNPFDLRFHFLTNHKAAQITSTQPFALSEAWAVGDQLGAEGSFEMISPYL